MHIHRITSLNKNNSDIDYNRAIEISLSYLIQIRKSNAIYM